MRIVQPGDTETHNRVGVVAASNQTASLLNHIHHFVPGVLEI